MTGILCISSYFKGNEFMEAAKKEGAEIVLVAKETLLDKPWAHDSIDRIFPMPDLEKLPDMIYAVTYLARTHQFDRIVALDEYDVPMAATLREHMLVPGMGATVARRFRDKLFMRNAAQEAGFKVPAFSPVLNHARLHEFTQDVPPPWVLKPRWEAGAMGIKRVYNSDELWGYVHELGDEQSFRVLEQFVPGDVYHVDALTVDGKTIFNSAQKYGHPPLNVAHDGGIFSTRTLPINKGDGAKLKTLNSKLIKALGMQNGATHAEFIKGHDDGEFYMLEIAGRVGGAHISDLIEMTSGINLWAEWGRLEVALARGETYKLPKVSKRYGGLLVCLAKQDHPDLSAYDDPEVIWRLDKKNHAGLIVTAEKPDRIETLVNAYCDRFVHDFMAVAPPLDHPAE